MTKLLFETDALGAALREVRAAVQRRNTIPILANVLIEATADGIVRLTTSDLDVMVSRTLPASVEQDVAFTVDANRLADVVGAFVKGSQTTLTFDAGAAVVTSGRARTRFSTLPRVDFPILAQKETQTQFTIEAKALLRGIGAVRHAISTEETRYYLNGIFCHEANGKLVFAATDGHRLARFVDDLPAGAAGMRDTILRTRCIELARAAAEARDMPITITLGDDKVTMAAGDYTLVAKVIDGTFPDYTRVIPTDWKSVVKIDRDALDEAVTRVTVAVSEKVRLVKVEVDRDVVRTSTTSVEHGTSVDEVPCEYAGCPIEIGFNGRYLRDALSALDVDTVELKLTDATSPTIISSPEASGMTLILMPMRV